MTPAAAALLARGARIPNPDAHRGAWHRWAPTPAGIACSLPGCGAVALRPLPKLAETPTAPAAG